MKLFQCRNNGDDDGESNLVLLFGLGLVGQSIQSMLLSSIVTAGKTLRFNWIDAEERFADKAKVLAEVAALRQAKRVKRVDVVWSAGRAGFSAGKAILDAEGLAFDDVLDVARQIVKMDDKLAVTFHLVSSAGGLFEGQTFVSALTAPKPLRPYGDAKLEMEHAVRALVGVRHFIYRPSTIYGYQHNARVGLVTTLIRNTQSFKVTTIYSSPQTLRDFVHADDIGRFVADRISDISSVSECYLLASAKPTSTEEVIGIVRMMMSRPVQLRFDPTPSNALHNSYRRSAIPVDFKSMALELGVRKTLLAMETAEFTRRQY